MQLSVSIDLKHHTCTFREVTALAAGAVYNPLIVEIDDPGVSAETLVLTVLRPGDTEEILAVSDKFEKVSGHRKLYKSTLNLSVDGVVRWYEEETAKYPNVTLDCIVEVSDATSNYCKTYVPIILRRLSGEVVKGVDGVSPEVDITKDGRALTISVTDISGTKSGVVYDGIDGADGATPVVRTVEVDGITNIGIKPSPVEAETLTPISISYNGVADKPSVNGKSLLSGDNSAAYLGLETVEHALTVQSSIESEVSRATAAENELTESLQTEVSRATGREGELEGAIISETNRAISVENSIKASVEAEVTRATGAEGELRQSITEVSTGLASHKSDVSNPHSVTAEQLGAVTSSTFLTELSSQAGLSIDNDSGSIRSDKSLRLSEYLTFDSSFANIYLQLAAGTVSIMGAQGASSPYVLSINGDTETSGSVICNNSYRIKPQYLPVTQNRAMAEGMGATIYDLTSYQLQETSDGRVTLVDANGAAVASFDKETGCILAGGGSIHFNGSWPGSAEVIEKDHLIRGNEIQGDKVGYPIYTVGDDGILKDRCINIVDTTGKTSWTAVFPESATAADFAIVYTCGCAPTFPASVTFKTDASLEAFSEWSFVEGSTYLITFTQIGSAVYYASMRELQ